MKLDAELMFECLIYLNAFYYPVFAICESIMTAAKYRSIIDTPSIGQDATVTFTRLFVELLKIILFRKYKDEKRSVAVFLTWITILALLYTFFVQSPVLKLESILCVMSTLLATTEIVFGTLQLIPWVNKNQYY